MKRLALILVLCGSIYAQTAITASITPVPWIVCEAFPSFCLMQAPAPESWIISVQTNAPAEVAAFQVEIHIALSDGTQQIKTIAFARDERQYGIDSHGKPIISTTQFVPLGRVKIASMNVTGLKATTLSTTVEN